MYVIPKKGYTIPDLDRRDMLPADGREVEDSLYWAALIRDGDVTVRVASSPVDAAPPVAVKAK